MPYGNARPRVRSLLSAYTADLGHMMSRRRSEEALRAAAIESVMANRAKSEFLANMSHELRTPLNAIIGFSEMITRLAPEKSSAGKPREYATYIAGAGRHLLEIINDILCLSRIESGGLELNLSLQNLRNAVEASILLVRRRLEEKRQQLIVDLPADMPTVVADELRLKQILINLLTNASKFTDEGGRITVSAAPRREGQFAVTVADTGRGMTQDEIVYVLKPFTQVRSDMARDQEGTGLGLPITKALVESHGGQLEISSAPGVGTTVIFTLPVAESAPEGIDRAHSE